MRKIVVILLTTLVFIGLSFMFNSETQCRDCPPYNTKCYSDYTCGAPLCGMSCVAVENSVYNRCR